LEGPKQKDFKATIRQYFQVVHASAERDHGPEHHQNV